MRNNVVTPIGSLISTNQYEFETLLNGEYILQFKYYPSTQIFSIKIINESQNLVYLADLNKDLMTEMDPSVVATFGDPEGMYHQFVQIAKQTQKGENMQNIQKQGFVVNSNGVIKVDITISLKSGKKHKQLILETQKRSMSDLQVLQLKMKKNKQQNTQRQSKMLIKIDNLQQQLCKTKQSNTALLAKLQLMKSEYKKEIQDMKEHLKTEKKETNEKIHEIKILLQSFKGNINDIAFDVQMLVNCGYKIPPIICKQAKNVFKQGKQIGKNIKNYFVHGKNNTIKKMGANQYTQFSFQNTASPSHRNFVDFEILHTKNNYLCFGFTHQKCLEQQDSKWNPLTITLFMLDYSIISEGKFKQSQNLSTLSKNSGSMSPRKQKQQKSQQNGTKNQTINVRMVLDSFVKQIQWYEQRTLIGQTQISQSFIDALKDNKVYPIVICCDPQDKILIK